MSWSISGPRGAAPAAKRPRSCIAVRDQQPNTQKAMANMDIYYPQLLDPSISLAGEFGVSAIPHLFLFGPDGKIVQQGMRGEGIDALLRTVFK